jgi:hypothetical protein
MKIRKSGQKSFIALIPDCYTPTAWSRDQNTSTLTRFQSGKEKEEREKFAASSFRQTTLPPLD